MKSQSNTNSLDSHDNNIKNNNEDVDCFFQWLTSHSPFESRPANMLVGLSTVAIANVSVNCDSAHSVGINSQEAIIGKTFADVKLQHGEEVVVHPQQMLNAIFSILDSTADLAANMKCELVPRPSSLFDDRSMRRPSKASLSSLLLSLVSAGPTEVPQSAIHAVNEGYLLHTVVRHSPATYAEICQNCVRYVQTHNGIAATVVFDGYAVLPSTKSEEQTRRAAKRMSADIEIAGRNKASLRQADFLGNPQNKQGLIKSARESLQAAGIDAKQAVSDSDTLIVSTALRHAAEGQPVVVTGTDTDLVMLVTKASSDSTVP